MFLRSQTARLLLATTFLLASNAYAQKNTLSVLVDVDRDGSAIFVEKLALASPLKEPLRWRLPTASVTPFGVRRVLFVELLEISDAAGTSLKSITRAKPDVLDVLIPVQPIARDTVRISYLVRNAVRFDDDADELFWNVGQPWSETADDVEFDISVPEGAPHEIRGQILQARGEFRIAQPVAFEGTKANVALSGRLASEIALDLTFTPGVLRPPSMARRIGWFLQANPVVLLPVLLFAIALTVRRRAARQLDSPVVTRYEPPPDLPPSEAGYLIDGRLDPRDFAAMLLDLARRGFIRIEAGTPDDEVQYCGPDFVLRLLKPMDHWAGAYSYEHVMLFHTFYGGHWTKLSSVSLRFYAVVPAIEQMIRDELQAKGLYVDPRRVTAERLLIAAVIGAVLFIAHAAGWFAVAQSWLLVAAVAASLGPAIMLFRSGVRHLTRKGVRVFTELRGLQEFIDSVEADRMQRITPDLFEQFLPYAVALGVEHRWAAAFSTISSGPPLWWDAAKAGNMTEFVRRIGSFPTSRPARAPSHVVQPIPPASATTLRTR